MSYPESSGPQNVSQLAGPGVPGMEDDTPLWHFDIELTDIPALVTRPTEFLQGTGFVQIIDESRDVTFVGRPDPDVEAGTHLCCYQSGSQTICHYHKA
jgi:hypothetical protein